MRENDLCCQAPWFALHMHKDVDGYLKHFSLSDTVHYTHSESKFLISCFLYIISQLPVTSVINFISTLENTEIKRHRMHFIRCFPALHLHLHCQKRTPVPYALSFHCPLYSKDAKHSLMAVHGVERFANTLEGSHPRPSLVEARAWLLTVHSNVSLFSQGLLRRGCGGAVNGAVGAAGTAKSPPEQTRRKRATRFSRKLNDQRRVMAQHFRATWNVTWHLYQVPFIKFTKVFLLHRNTSPGMQKLVAFAFCSHAQTRWQNISGRYVFLSHALRIPSHLLYSSQVGLHTWNCQELCANLP